MNEWIFRNKQTEADIYIYVGTNKRLFWDFFKILKGGIRRHQRVSNYGWCKLQSSYGPAWHLQNRNLLQASLDIWRCRAACWSMSAYPIHVSEHLLLDFWQISRNAIILNKKPFLWKKAVGVFLKIKKGKDVLGCQNRRKTNKQMEQLYHLNGRSRSETYVVLYQTRKWRKNYQRYPPLI